jgi:hypothetical protein
MVSSRLRQSPVKLPMQQVIDWLEKLGMSEYAQRFADNDIDFSILGDLTDQDLKDLGVASLGHRRRILRAIADLDRPEATAAPPATVPAPPPRPVVSTLSKASTRSSSSPKSAMIGSVTAPDALISIGRKATGLVTHDADPHRWAGQDSNLNQPVMNGWIKVAAVDFPAFLLAFGCVCCASVPSFLVRNWCGSTNRLKST